MTAVMKTRYKLFLGLVVFPLVLFAGAYWLLMRPAFQKNLIEGRLPVGSSLKHVHLTLDSLELEELRLRLKDGTIVKLERLNVGISPWAALFDRTIRLEGLKVDGLLVEFPEKTSDPSNPGASAVETFDSASESSDIPLYAIDQIDWMLDLDSIDLNGVFVDPARNCYAFKLSSGRVAPGTRTELEASIQLESNKTYQGGLQALSSNIRVLLTQRGEGGFDSIHVASQTLGSDASGVELLSVAQTLELSVDGFEQSAELNASVDADLLRPDVLLPELAALQGLSLQGDFQATVTGEVLTLNSATLDASENGVQVASLVLKQGLTLGRQQQFSGELMNISLTGLPLVWVNPWLGGALELSGAPFSAEFCVAGGEDGSIQITSRRPIEVGPFSLSKDKRPLLDDVFIRMHPTVGIGADNTIQYKLGDFQLLDRSGDVVSGSLSGSMLPVLGGLPLSGLQTRARLQLDLSDLFKQPMFVGRASILGGQARVELELDGAAEYPAKLETVITDFRVMDFSASPQDYRLAAQVKQSESGISLLDASFEAGSEDRPSTNLQLSGSVNAEKQPIPFKVNIISTKVVQRDMDRLLAAFKADESGMSRPLSTSSSSASSPLQGGTQNPPPWAALDGEVAIKIDALTLASGHELRGLSANARLSEALLILDHIEASLDGGGLQGGARVEYHRESPATYCIASNCKFENIDPLVFSKNDSGTFPIQGRFNGELQFVGSGATLGSALEDAEGGLTITGRDGILSAFELDNRSQLGLLGAGLLGQQLDRPGITAMAQAIPYFKDMPFQNFTLKLTRGDDRQIRIAELNFLGDNVRIQGDGFIAASGLSEVIKQPLSLRLALSAKGRLVSYLETLQLLGPDTSEDGFRGWKQNINIGGTLGDPDTSEFQRILADAARRAIRGKDLEKSNVNRQLPFAQSSEEPKEKSKEEQLVDDIEMGLDILNALFGN